MRVVEIDSPLHAELRAILFGLEVAINNSYLSILIESDSLVAVQEVRKQQEIFCMWEGIISHIGDLSRDGTACSLIHVRRSGNELAHNLAKLSIEVETFKVWRNTLPPMFCNPDNS
ncbi:hypothetical protein CRYUN_Cryun04dG0121000 [Craigia yunnanensis]